MRKGHRSGLYQNWWQKLDQEIIKTFTGCNLFCQSFGGTALSSPRFVSPFSSVNEYLAGRGSRLFLVAVDLAE